MKHLECFRKLITLAITLEWLEKDPFIKYKSKFDKVERQYINQEELTRIEEKQFSIERLQQVKDLFIFSCYTGLAYIDVMNLTPSLVFRELMGSFGLLPVVKKIQTFVRIPLLPKAIEIIEKYKNNSKVNAEGASLSR